MSRGGSDDYDEDFPNEGAFWERRARTALNSKRGRQALFDLREALLALPRHRLVARALCTVGATFDATENDWRKDYVDQLLDEQGEGVCAVGAYIWHQKVKAGADPDAAMRDLPMLDDEAYGIEETARTGEAGGLTYTLAWTLADQNDEGFRYATPEERWRLFMEYLDKRLGAPVNG